MPFEISITDDADRQFRSLTARERSTLASAISSRLQNDPTTPTKAIKKLRLNPFAEFELRVGSLRILYNVEEAEVVILLVGRKQGNALLVEGKEFHAHQSDPPDPLGNGSGKDAD